MATTDHSPSLIPAKSLYGFGFAMALIAAVFWGLSAVAAQKLFDSAHLSAGWLVSVRMGIAGVSILAVVWRQKGWRYVVAPLLDARARMRLLIFAVFGLWLVQYAYMAAIRDGNAAAATLLQYTAPAFIILYVALASKTMPAWRQMVAVGLSLGGTWLLVSNGQFGMLRLSFGGLSWGITSAIALAFYTLYPGSLLREWGSTRIVGWGMIGGAILSEAVAPVWSPNAPWWSLSDILLIAFVVLLGTLAAFWLYLASLRNISPAIASVVASAEPLVATAGSVLWLGVTLRGFQDLGAVSIIAAVLLLAWRSRRVEESPQ